MRLFFESLEEYAKKLKKFFFRNRLFNNPYEKNALQYLKKQGLIFIESNFTCPRGEIDLIMIDGEHLVFVEVRFRSEKNKLVTAEETIDVFKQRKVCMSARFFLAKNPKWTEWPMRFDVIAINGSTYLWIKSAFTES